MTSDIVKCVNCNVVINEVLAFIQNKIDVMDEESLQQICTSAFSTEDILTAKNLLFNSIPNTKKIRRREGKKKTQRDLDDIICLLKGTDPELFPVFVARDLHKLPPITFDHIDVTRFLKDQLRLQNLISDMQEKFVTMEQFKLLKSDLENMKHTSIANNFVSNINRKRGACLQDSFSMDSGPVGLQYVSIKSPDTNSAASKVNDRTSIVRNEDIIADIFQRVEAPLTTAVSNIGKGSNNNAASSIVSPGCEKRTTRRSMQRVEDTASTAVSMTHNPVSNRQSPRCARVQCNTPTAVPTRFPSDSLSPLSSRKNRQTRRGHW